MDIQLLPENSGLVPITPEEEARRLMFTGRILVLVKPDGSRWRVLEPWETGDEA